mmetsp:Transcript_7229/g.22636  ORF Transcript_7229/g.22636 Transcript_7229/m.22636 type:complete len:364 (-) Transcript_7229:904-1995(-)
MARPAAAGNGRRAETERCAAARTAAQDNVQAHFQELEAVEERVDDRVGAFAALLRLDEPHQVGHAAVPRLALLFEERRERGQRVVHVIGCDVRWRRRRRSAARVRRSRHVSAWQVADGALGGLLNGLHRVHAVRDVAFHAVVTGSHLGQRERWVSTALRRRLLSTRERCSVRRHRRVHGHVDVSSRDGRGQRRCSVGSVQVRRVQRPRGRLCLLLQRRVHVKLFVEADTCTASVARVALRWSRDRSGSPRRVWLAGVVPLARAKVGLRLRGLRASAREQPVGPQAMVVHVDLCPGDAALLVPDGEAVDELLQRLHEVRRAQQLRRRRAIVRLGLQQHGDGFAQLLGVRALHAVDAVQRLVLRL